MLIHIAISFVQLAAQKREVFPPLLFYYAAASLLPVGCNQVVNVPTTIRLLLYVFIILEVHSEGKHLLRPLPVGSIRLAYPLLWFFGFCHC